MSITRGRVLRDEDISVRAYIETSRCFNYLKVKDSVRCSSLSAWDSILVGTVIVSSSLLCFGLNGTHSLDASPDRTFLRRDAITREVAGTVFR